KMTIHVLVAVTPAMLQGIIIRSLEKQPDFRISSILPGDDWVDTASRIVPNVVITTSNATDGAADFLFRNARTKVLAIKQDGRHAFLFELAPERLPLGELDCDDLVSTIRNAVGKPTQVDW